MPAARNPTYSMVELPAKGAMQSDETEVDQDQSLAGLFQRLGQGDVHPVLTNFPRPGLDSSRRSIEGPCPGSDFAMADVVSLEVELAQEFSLLLSRLQRSRLPEA